MGVFVNVTWRKNVFFKNCFLSILFLGGKREIECGSLEVLMCMLLMRDKLYRFFNGSFWVAPTIYAYLILINKSSKYCLIQTYNYCFNKIKYLFTSYNYVK